MQVWRPPALCGEAYELCRRTYAQTESEFSTGPLYVQQLPNAQLDDLCNIVIWISEIQFSATTMVSLQNVLFFCKPCCCSRDIISGCSQSWSENDSQRSISVTCVFGAFLRFISVQFPSWQIRHSFSQSNRKGAYIQNSLFCNTKKLNLTNVIQTLKLFWGKGISVGVLIFTKAGKS